MYVHTEGDTVSPAARIAETGPLYIPDTCQHGHVPSGSAHAILVERLPKHRCSEKASRSSTQRNIKPHLATPSGTVGSS